ncbi:MAG: nucleotidyltransferase [Vagococcus sp.]|uniref:nucleotidyltransferase n=1 Tax=Vagococcus sp. TaxID=1933889 RepID=UPI002FC90A0D
MKSCGVIVEYNPFHNGHHYHLKEAKKQSQADCLVAVMSGNFLQRGEPAIVDKWTRTNEALKNGADLVIELPFAYAVQSADYFTRGGVKLLHSLGVDALCFGTDVDGKMDYEMFGTFHQENMTDINKEYQELKNNGQSYPQQMTEVYRKLLPSWALNFSSPNHILGMGYAKENASYNSPMTLHAIKRLGNQYHDEEVSNDIFASATSIRKSVLSGKTTELKQVVPKITYADLRTASLVEWEKAWPFLKYQLSCQSTKELSRCYQMVEGLEYRFKEAAKLSNNFEEFVSRVKSKRYTWTRIQRVCLYVLLQVKQEEVEAVWQSSYIRVLGFNDTGRAFLKQQKSVINLPVVTNINKKNESMLALDIKVGQIYSLLEKNLKEQDYYQSPIYIKEENQ